MTQLALSVKDAAAEVGVSEDTIRNEIRDQRLVAYRVGEAKRTIRIHRDDLEKWFRANERVGEAS